MKTQIQTPKGLVRIGSLLRINHLDNGDSKINDSRYDGMTGRVTHFNEVPDEHTEFAGIHGTWGGLSILPFQDDFDILEF